MWRRLPESFREGALLCAFVVVANAPFAVTHTLVSHSRWETIVVAVLGAVPIPLACFGTLWLAPRWTGATRSAAPRLASASFAFLFALVYVLGTLGLTWFLAQRGVPATLRDVEATTLHGTIRGELPILASAHVWPALVPSVVALGWLSLRLFRAPAAVPFGAGAWALAAPLALALCCLVARGSPRAAWALKPLRDFSLVRPGGLRDQVLQVQRDQEDGNLFGIAAAIGCPASAPLDAPPAGVRGRRIASELAATSARLFARGRPVTFRVVLLESIGAEDVGALDGEEATTPFLDALVRGDGGLATVAARDTYQAGSRTVYAFDAVLCGLGSTPYQIALTRDLGALHLRCLPAILHDVGIPFSFSYAGDAKYDGMQAWLVEQGPAQLLDFDGYGGPKGAWGASDRELFLRVLGRPPSPHTELELVMTLSSHDPYPTPDDMPPELAEATRLGLTPGTEDHVANHFVTVRYVDWVLAEMLPRLRQRDAEEGRESVFLLLGDHSSGVFGRDAPTRASKIPMILWLPDDLAPHLSALRAAVGEGPLSQNDVARMLAALLAHSPELRSAPTQVRRGSLGGQVLGPAFAPPREHPDAVVWSVDAHARSLFVSPTGFATHASYPATHDLSAADAPTRGALAWIHAAVRAADRSCTPR